MSFFLLNGQVSQLNDPLMGGGKIHGYAKNATSVLVCTDGGLFRTNDGGQSWTNATQTFNPLLVKSQHVMSIGNDYYAESDYSSGVGIYKSTDNGSNWTALNASIFSTWAIQSLGKISNALYVIGVNNSIPNQQSGQLFSSTDGITWTPKASLWANSNQGYNCKLLSFNQDKLYIFFQNSLYYTTDGTAKTAISVSGLGISSFSSDAQSAIQGDALGNLYYYQDGMNVIYKYNFTTSVWSDISTGKLPANPQIMGMSVTDNALFLVALPSGSNMKLYKSSDHGSTFIEQTSTGIATPMISNIIEVSSAGFIGNGLYNEILYSTTGGSTWSVSTNPFIASYAGNLTLSGTSLLYSIQNRGVIFSSNQGMNWSANNTGIPGYGGIAFFVNELIQVKDTLFSFLQPSPFSQSIVLYKSSNHGTSWNASPIPSPYTNGSQYSFAGKCDSVLFVNYYDSVSSKIAVIATFNNGASWEKQNNVNSDQLTYFKGSRNFLFAFTGYNQNYNDFSNVFKANNFGESYTDISSTVINGSFLIKRTENSQGNKSEAIMDIDKPNNRAIFAIADRTNANVDRLYLYNIASNVWSELIPIGIPNNYVANCIKYTGNNSWLLATNSGLYKSINGGANWTIAHDENAWQKGITVNKIQLINNEVFLGTLADGIWTVNLTTGITEQFSENELQAYPNPSTELVEVKLPDFNGKTAIVSLYGLDGKVIFNKVANSGSFQIDIHNLATGKYLLIVNSNNHLYRKSIIRK